MIIKDYKMFLWKFLKHPKKIGSIIPSSNSLTKKMLEDLPWNSLDNIVELGAGTGVFTAYIAAHKKNDCKAIIIEQDNIMRTMLEKRHPDLLFGSQAENLLSIIKEKKLSSIDCIICSLPFASLSCDLRNEILCNIKIALKDGGRFIAFQYSPQMYYKFSNSFKEVSLNFELRNIPPAFVYHCYK